MLKFYTSSKTYKLSGQSSGLAIVFPAITYFKTSSLDNPWYGCDAKVAISHKTTPYDL